MTHQGKGPAAEAEARVSRARTPANRRGRAGIALLCLLLVALIAGAVFFWPHRAPPAADAAAAEPVPVILGESRVADVPVTLEGLGTVQAFNSVTLRAMVDGPLVEMRFREGQDVRRGDVLARIDPRGFQAALDQATAKKAQDEAQLANARLDLARYQKLVASNYTSAQTADTAKATVAQLEAQVRQDQAQIDTARTNLSYTDITAPIDGRTGVRLVDIGNIVHPGETTGITTLAQLRPISVTFTLPQQALPQIAAAMKDGAPAVDAVQPDAGGGGGPAPGTVIERGTLEVLDNQVDQSTGTLKLKATFPNENLALWPGAFVNARVRTGVLKGVLTVPEAAMQRGPIGAFLYAYNDDGTVSRRVVTVGHEDADVAVVTGGLPPGQRVVIEGAARLSDGSKVTVAPATVSPAPAS